MLLPACVPMHLPSAFAGLAAHAICNRFVPHSLTEIFSVLLLPPIALTVIESHALPAHLFTAYLGTYLAALAISIAAYRVSPFHPLAKYPGPWLARISGWWSVWHALDGKQYLMYRRLHERYGDIVRTGPNFIHVRDAAAIPVVLGPRWHRSAGYETTLPPGGIPSVITATHPAKHKERRQRWDKAFTGTALQHYEHLLLHRLAQLRDALDSRWESALDLSEWLSLFMLDFMGDFALGGLHNFMAAGRDTHGLHRIIVDAMGMSDICSRIPWVRPFAHLVPGPLDDLLSTSLRVARERKASTSTDKDLFYYLIGDDDSDVLSDDALAQDALVAIVGGSDTSASVISHAIYRLLCNPPVLARLRAELDGAMTDDEEPDPSRLAKCKYLQAVINETMRLAPAIPNGAPRMVPPGESVVVAGHVMPPDTVVYIAYYPLFRDVRYFSDPDTFLPARWLDDAASQIPGLVHDPRAFIPFNYGPTVCAGKSLAQRVVRAVLALLVRRYDIAFAPGHDRKRWEADLKDRYILARGALPVVLKRRQ